MGKRMPRKIKKAARSISVIIPEVVEEKHSGNECVFILNSRVKYKAKIGRMTNTMLSVIHKIESKRCGILNLERIKKLTERKISFEKMMNDSGPIIPSEKPDTTSWARSFIPDDARKITFDNGVTMKFLPWYDPTTGKTY